MNNLKVLIVENSRIQANYLETLMEEYHYDVIGKVVSGEEALISAKKERPDLILMDIELDGKIDGIETYIKIKETIDNEIAVIFLSKIQDERVWKKAKKTVPKAQITKPFDDYILLSAIEDAFSDISTATVKQTYENYEESTSYMLKKRAFFKQALSNRETAYLCLLFDEILFIKANGKHCTVYTIPSKDQTEPQIVDIKGLLHEITPKLPASAFIQVHRSYVVNFYKIRGLKNDRISFDWGKGVPVSDNYKVNLLKAMDL